jgi:hypothetical protein
MLFSLKDLSSKLSPSHGSEGLHTVKTNSFTLHHFESITGMMFIINTDPDIQGTYEKHSVSIDLIRCWINLKIQNPLFYFINCRYVPGSPAYLLTFICGLCGEESVI